MNIFNLGVFVLFVYLSQLGKWVKRPGWESWIFSIATIVISIEKSF